MSAGMECQKIFIVEDDRAIREAFHALLEQEGYGVESFANGQDAIDRLRRAPEPCLVLLDMMMPVMDGAALAASLATSHPDLPIIATSGLNANGGLAQARNAGVRRFIAKPYTTGELLAGVQDALRGGPS
jgi:CheY-like chemotaxis protein